MTQQEWPNDSDERRRLQKLAPGTLPCPECSRPVVEVTLEREKVRSFDPVLGVQLVPLGRWRWRCAGCGLRFEPHFVHRLRQTPLLSRELDRAKAGRLARDPARAAPGESERREEKQGS